MSTAAPTPVPADVPSSTVARRAAAAEWSRLWSVRSTWLATLAGVALVLLVGVAAGLTHDGPEPAPIWVPAEIAIVPAQFAFLLAVVLATTSDYSTGAIRSSLQWVPRRSVLFAARLAVPVATATAAAMSAAAASHVVVRLLVGDAAEVVAGDMAASLGRIALVVAFGGVLSVGIGLLLRSTAGALTSMFLLMLVLPITFGNAPVAWLVTIADHLPGRVVVQLLVVDAIEMSAGEIAAVAVAWIAAAVLAGGWSLLHRDAT